MSRLHTLTLSLALAAACAPAAHATAVNLISNGSFETTTNGNGELMPNATTGKYITSATGWTTATTTGTDSTSNNAGYPFLFITNNAVTTGFNDAWDNGVRYLWGVSNGGANTWNGSSPDGGNYLVMDADYHHTAISQAVSNLVLGTDYTVTFAYAAAQFYGFTTATTETLQVSLGTATQSTATISLPSTGFSGWLTGSMTFRYDGSSNILSFLATGGPVGAPPMVLLDNVTMSAVPEPASLALFGLGLGAVAFVAVRRRRGMAGLAA